MAAKTRRVDGAFVSRFAAEERVKDIRHLYPAYCTPRVVKDKRIRAKGGGYRTFKVTVSAKCPTSMAGYDGIGRRSRGRSVRSNRCKVTRDSSGKLRRNCGRGRR